MQRRSAGSEIGVGAAVAFVDAVSPGRRVLAADTAGAGAGADTGAAGEAGVDLGRRGRSTYWTRTAA